LAILFYMRSTTPSSILIVKTSAIGDVIQTFPVVDYLRQKFPEARIDWVVEQGIASMLRAHPQVDHVFAMDSRSWRRAPLCMKTRQEVRAFARQLRETSYDLLFDVQGNMKSGLATAVAKAKWKVGFGWNSVRERGNLLFPHQRINVPAYLNVRFKYLGLVQRYFCDDSVFESQGVRLKTSLEETERLEHICQEEAMKRPLKLMVCFGSKWPNKRLEEGTLTALLDQIALECGPSFVFIYGDEEEKRIAERLALHFEGCSLSVGQLSLPLWQALMWKMDGVIAVDSAALHLCGTTQTPSFSVFGPSLASFYKPPGERHLCVQGSCPYGRTFSSRCPILRTCSTGACIRHLQADELFAAYKNWQREL
jgi:heptosyltransferase I